MSLQETDAGVNFRFLGPAFSLIRTETGDVLDKRRAKPGTHGADRRSSCKAGRESALLLELG